MTEENKDSAVWEQFDPDSHQTDPISLKITGTVPEWLTGSLYRNGSGVFKYHGDKMNHLFDGMAVLHKYIIENGEVKFHCKVLDTDSWKKCSGAKRLLIDQYGTKGVPDPCKSVFARFCSSFKKPEPNDNTNVSIIEKGDEMWALTESSQMYRVDQRTLKQTKRLDISKYVAVHTATAHPHVDKDGTSYNMGTKVTGGKAYNIIKMPSQENGNMDFNNAELVASAESRWKTRVGYTHSFGMSKNYFILLEQPFSINLVKVFAKRFSNMTTSDCMSACQGENTIFHVLKKDGGDPIKIKFYTDPMFVFHFINCYEESGQLVVDCAGYDDVAVIDKLYLQHIENGKAINLTADCKFRRYVLPLDIEGAKPNENLVQLSTNATAVLQPNGSVYLKPDYLVEDGIIIELPKINYQDNNAKPYQYVYGCTVFSSKNKLVKIDIKNKEYKEVDIEDTHLNGEPIFVGKPNAIVEDEGVVLAPIIAEKPGALSYLMILDAETMKEIARAEIPADKISSFTFHGCFTSNTVSNQQTNVVGV